MATKISQIDRSGGRSMHGCVDSELAHDTIHQGQTASILPRYLMYIKPGQIGNNKYESVAVQRWLRLLKYKGFLICRSGVQSFIGMITSRVSFVYTTRRSCRSFSLHPVSVTIPLSERCIEYARKVGFSTITRDIGLLVVIFPSERGEPFESGDGVTTQCLSSRRKKLSAFSGRLIL